MREFMPIIFAWRASPRFPAHFPALPGRLPAAAVRRVVVRPQSGSSVGRRGRVSVVFFCFAFVSGALSRPSSRPCKACDQTSMEHFQATCRALRCHCAVPPLPPAAKKMRMFVCARYFPPYYKTAVFFFCGMELAWNAFIMSISKFGTAATNKNIKYLKK